MMKMTDGDGDCVRDVMRLRHSRERQQGLDHLLYLELFRVAVPNHRLLHKPG